jgi:DNA-binding LacI/PurR family transcriptional regulator
VILIDLKNPAPLYLQIADEIRQDIASGKLKIGDAIGSHQELADLYDVSLITIRKARNVLINEGILFSRIGKGTYVAQKPHKVDFERHKTVGFVLRDLQSPFFSKILYSVEKSLNSNHFNLLISSTANVFEKEESQIEYFLKIGVSGLVIASMSRQYHVTPIIKKLHDTGFPYAVVSYIADKNIYYVGIDHESGGYIATKHLLGLGCRKIAYINSKKGSFLGEIRKKGYIRALNEYGISYEKHLTFHLQKRGEWFDYESGYKIGEQFCHMISMPEAVFAYNDLAALGFEKAILAGGFRVPEDVAIVGFDDIRRSRIAPVPLTTVHQPTEEIGKMAVKIILDKINGKKVKSCGLLEPKLVIRESCGAKLQDKVSSEIVKVG